MNLSHICNKYTNIKKITVIGVYLKAYIKKGIPFLVVYAQLPTVGGTMYAVQLAMLDAP